MSGGRHYGRSSAVVDKAPSFHPAKRNRNKMSEYETLSLPQVSIGRSLHGRSALRARAARPGERQKSAGE